MKADGSFVMLDPATDEILAECSGPSADGACPVSDTPPYLCAGLHLVGRSGADGKGVSLTVTSMQPGRCPLAAAVAQEAHSR
jgi:cell division protein FtsI/penicillin-binding protein 2